MSDRNFQQNRRAVFSAIQTQVRQLGHEGREKRSTRNELAAP